MAHPFRDSAKSTSRSKFKAISGKSGHSEGDVDGSQLKPAPTRLVDAGYVKGAHSTPRIDKRARGGRTGSKININIISTPNARQQDGPPPLPLAAPLGAAAAPPPGSLPFPAPGGGAPPAPMMKKGGLVKMTGGAEGGLGRLQKAKNAKRMRGG